MAASTSHNKAVREALETRSDSSSSNKKNEDLLAILPFLFMMNGSQYMQCSMVVMIAAALGVLATQRLLTSPLHK